MQIAAALSRVIQDQTWNEFLPVDPIHPLNVNGAGECAGFVYI
jgi:hypothetical protein